MRFFILREQDVFKFRSGIRPYKFRANHAAGADSRGKIVSVFQPIMAYAHHGGKFDVVSIHSSFGPKQSFIHLDAAADLHGTDRIGGYRLIHVGQPSQRWRCAARTALSHAFRLDRARSLKNCFVDVSHGIDGVLRRFVVVRRVVTLGHGVDVVQL